MRITRCLQLLVGTAGLTSIALADSNLTDPGKSQRILKGDFKPPQVWKNVVTVRNINLDKGYVRETSNIVVENVDKSKKPQSEYYLPFEYDLIGKVGGLEVRNKKEPSKPKFYVDLVEQEAVLSEEESSKPLQYYVVKFDEPVKYGSQITLSISSHTLGSLEPLPATINQDQKQFLTHTFSAYAPSAYVTDEQKTKVKFPTADVPEYTKTKGLISGEDPTRQGSTYTYGTYKTSKVPPGTSYPVTVRYEFTKPVLACSLLERDVEISHWGGNLAIEERYWLRNDGARLANHFSRVTWATQAYYNAPTSALRELKIPLKAGSVDPYFTDDIGNVSTSKYRPNDVRDALLELRPRYPVFGGWKYSFKIGWNNALSSFLRKVSSGDSHVLKVPFMEGPKMSEGVQYDRVQIRVILPEGSANLRWTVVGGTNIPTLQAETSLHKTFMDTVGRSELKLSAINLVDEARDAELIVTYDYPPFAALRKPMSLFVGAFCVFIASWVVGRVDTSIGRKKQESK